LDPTSLPNTNRKAIGWDRMEVLHRIHGRPARVMLISAALSRLVIHSGASGSRPDARPDDLAPGIV
jgi:hypothetical protein